MANRRPISRSPSRYRRALFGRPVVPVVTHGRTKRKYLHTRGLKLRSERGAYLGLGGEKGRARRGEKGDEEMQQMNKGKEGDGTRWWYGRPTRFIVA